MTSETLCIQDKTDESFCIHQTSCTKISLANLVDCFVYCLKEFDSIEINSLKNCTIFIAKSSNVIVNNGSNIKLTCFSNEITISHTNQSTFYMFVLEKCLIQNQSDVIIAPYNACFNSGNLVPVGENLWDKPIIEEGSTHKILEPTDFIPLVIPYGDEPQGILAPIPSSYTRSLQWREKVAEERRQLILQFCQRAPSYAKELQDKISASFKSRVLDDKEEGRQLRQLARTIYM